MTESTAGAEARSRPTESAGRLAGLLLVIAFVLHACAAPEAPEAPAAPSEPAPAPSPPPGPEAIVDPQGRVIVEAMEYPWSAIGRVNTGGRGFCTGILVGARRVLTTARCLYNGVEGRWWGANEVHFVAGYQRDAYLIHSGVARYRVAPGFVPAHGTTLGNVANNWAVLTLAAPIGHRAGWFAVQWLDQEVLARFRRAEAFALRAGYRKGRSHVITVSLGCAGGRLFLADGAMGSACEGTPPDAELPVLVFLSDEFRALGDNFLPPRVDADDAPAATFGARRRNGRLWGESRAPQAGGPAAPLPHDTLGRLLSYLGHLDGPPDERDPDGLAAAIRRFQGAAGLAVTGEASVALLGRVIEAVRQAHVRSRPGPWISMLTDP
ncbi:MAG: peptidoglycan-binding protein [Kiloniellaceae bacterium]